MREARFTELSVRGLAYLYCRPDQCCRLHISNDSLEQDDRYIAKRRDDVAAFIALIGAQGAESTAAIRLIRLISGSKATKRVAKPGRNRRPFISPQP